MHTLVWIMHTFQRAVSVLMGRVISITFNNCHVGKLRTLNRSGLSRARVGTLYVQKKSHTQLLNLSDPPSSSIFTFLEYWGVLVLEPDFQPKRGGGLVQLHT